MYGTIINMKANSIDAPKKLRTLYLQLAGLAFLAIILLLASRGLIGRVLNAYFPCFDKETASMPCYAAYDIFGVMIAALCIVILLPLCIQSIWQIVKLKKAKGTL